MDQRKADYSSRGHFMAIAAMVMRRILVSHAEKRAAAKRGKVAKVEALLEKKPTLLESRTGKYANKWTNTGDNTPLHIAAVYGRLKVVELLLEKGATVDARNEGDYTPLHLAAMNKHREVAELLLAKGADPSAKQGIGGTPLHLAVLPTIERKIITWRSPEPRAGTELVELLLAQGVDINVRNDRGNTPLHTAAWIAGTDEVIELLLAQGADTNIRNNSGQTPLMLAEHYGQQANAELLRVGLSATASAGPAPVPAPERPQPISSFAVEFAPARAAKYPPTDITEVKRYKTVAHWPEEPDWVSDAEEPTRPYAVVGTLHFPIAWHFLEKGVSSCPAQEGLVVHHVRAVGGHAVLLCEVDEQSRGSLFEPVATISYRAITLHVIRWTDE